ncbi:tRNA (uridine(34)/cytosine(34)/5-carboxymethylaminomethyluridine(34)-2'-O)-methyltransferase TrmL [Aerococcus kribbianus]|uniref:Putative tRNA (cytidine(34)-2'-O)-methyltransferase n=1 Tax=Aerococcus kribbianus TaxID=2999064 RepID=A0A9X3FSX9_9LACT|nr:MULTISPECIES: tRNA (uridine(34)/cytosine(34)/5-carboxymethylaminomethyluridine(34)-2'-O)-methyltransferase TrmL [unclassified Aerococcus]MCZ0717798.1 tRNA (uridine(34)/cytosine(34)/5-carboxymethylaminomethyluridine(34)-2'-O)-methyltransferase TrmL [Aerococcus sp. YH-aer221]MCZ0726085.1 tRNA (uridine(34)/cytosine(34)/5-carboxymethylaminomethyluridine(34)-2'-O)-methyltransferase TrmL [Aerococcus sp. YH-aer222]
MTNHIVLFEPEIPANTGNISRTCAATDTHLHLIEPLGFKTNDKYLKRAGLDYWDNVDITYHQSLDDFMAYLGNRRLYLISKFSHQTYSDPDFSNPNDEDLFFMFGKETTGLPEAFMRANSEKCLRLPMDDRHVRSLNLSNTAAIVIYEVLRQQNFNQLERQHHYANDKLD